VGSSRFGSICSRLRPMGKGKALSSSLRLRAKRRLKRNVSDVPLPVEFGQVMCIKGGLRKHWLVVPIETVSGEICVPVASHSDWLHQLLTGMCYKTLKCVVRDFVHDCFREFHATFNADKVGASSQVEAGRLCSQESSGGEAVASSQVEDSAASSQVVTHLQKKKGKAAIMSDSDESSDTRHLAKNRPTRRPRRRGQFVNVTIRGFAFKFTVSNGPKLLVPVQGPWTQSMVSHLLLRAGATKPLSMSSSDVASSQEQESKSPTFEPRSLLTNLDKGRIRWRPPSASQLAAWVIVYEGDSGKIRTFRTGLIVHAHTLSGSRVPPQEFKDNVAKVLARARDLWNEMDKSKRERYSTSKRN
jgi:hypothetical protein